MTITIMIQNISIFLIVSRPLLDNVYHGTPAGSLKSAGYDWVLIKKKKKKKHDVDHVFSHQVNNRVSHTELLQFLP